MLKSKFFLIVFFLITVGSMGFYFYSNNSYKKSLEAKFYYTLGDYKKANLLSSSAYSENSYNRMALTVMNQSQYAIDYLDYINEAESYLEQINEIAKKRGVNRADRLRIKMMCTIMIGKYKTLKGSVLIKEGLRKEGTEIYLKFLSLKQKVIESL